MIAVNLASLDRIIRFNAGHGIQLYRITSQIIPFAFHPVSTLEWWREFEEPLDAIGAFVRENDMRVSMRPVQCTVLNSPRPEVVTAAAGDLEWHCRFLDALGVDQTCKVNIPTG